MKTNTFPLLTKLLAAQLFAGFVGLTGFGYAYYHIQTQELSANISKAKQKITPTLEMRQEKLRSWKYLGLESAIQSEVNQLKTEYGIRELKIIPFREANQPADLNLKERIITPATAQDDELVLYTLIDTSEIADPSKNNMFFYSFGGIALFLLFLISLTAHYIFRQIYSPLLMTFNAIRETEKNLIPNLDEIPATGEIKSFIKILNEQLVERKNLEKNAAMLTIAQQVSHDIRSPLAALNMILDDLHDFPEEKRQIIRNAISRIKDIANGLSIKKRINIIQPPKEGEEVLKPRLSSHMILYSVENMISEKHMSRPRDQFRIHADFAPESYGLFSYIDPIEFQRVISNLLNNSIESGAGVEIRVSIDSPTAESVIVQIEDNGRGIPSKVMDQIGNRGFTFGKESGSGLGLHHAMTSIQNWGGTIKIDSKEKKGTKVTITLPRSNPPEWFKNSIDLSAVKQTVIVDDDESVHSIWKKKIARDSIHLKSPDELRKMLFNLDDYEGYLFLVDHEFIGDSTNGLALIKELDISTQSILVTSRFDSRKIQADCENMSLKIIPKFMAPQITVVQ
jgi:signal transduction histidine kinase